MESIKLTVVCDRSQAENISVQAANDWARVVITCSRPIDSGSDISSHLQRAARMIVASGGPFDLEHVDIGVMLAGYDIGAAPDLYDQVSEAWIIALGKCCAAAAKPSDLAFTPMTRPVAALPTSSTASNGTGASQPTLSATISAPPGITPPTTSAGTHLPAYIPTGTSISVARLFEAARTQSSAPAPASTKDERRAKMIREMVRTVQQYVETYGAAPDFGSSKPAIVEKVHNYIKSVTTRQTVSPEILDAVRQELAKQGSK